VETLKALCHDNIGSVFRFRTSETRTHTRIPLTRDDGAARRPPAAETVYHPIGILGQNIQKNSHLLSILEQFQEHIGTEEITVLLLDVGVFDRAVKVTD
jgi:hypothetical protein